MKLTSKGKILEAAYVKPKRLNFGKISKSATSKTLTAVLTPGDGGPIKPVLLPKEVKGVKATLKEIEPGKRYELEVTLVPPFDGKRLLRSVELDSGVKDTPSIRVSISATFKPRVIAKPYRLRLPKDASSGWEDRVKLVWDTPQKAKILKVEVNEEGFSARAVEENGEQWIVVSMNDKYQPILTPRLITVTTDDKEAPTVRITISPSGRSTARTPKERALAAGRKRAAAQKASASKNTGAGAKTNPKEPQTSPAG
ncbi:MAG: hypothetical protein IH987_13725 [Planctomycetes bacterium]|nr:hypothetical protein [Planctomycetota bacterium]